MSSSPPPPSSTTTTTTTPTGASTAAVGGRRIGFPFAHPSESASIGWRKAASTATTSSSPESAASRDRSSSAADGRKLPSSKGGGGRKGGRKRPRTPSPPSLPPQSSESCSSRSTTIPPIVAPVVVVGPRPASAVPPPPSSEPISSRRGAADVGGGGLAAAAEGGDEVVRLEGFRSEISIVGKAKIEVLDGEVEILGCRLFTPPVRRREEGGGGSECDDGGGGGGRGVREEEEEAGERRRSVVEVDGPGWTSALAIVNHRRRSSSEEEEKASSSLSSASVVRVSSVGPKRDSRIGLPASSSSTDAACSTSASSSQPPLLPTPSFRLFRGDDDANRGRPPALASIIIPERWEAAADEILEGLTTTKTTDGDGDGNDDEGAQAGAFDPYGEALVEEEDDDDPLDDGASDGGDAGRDDDDDRRSSFPARTLICGAKGVGKSTYVRYVANRILTRPAPTPRDVSATSDDDASTPSGKRAVAILDCDVGQPELAPPGLLSLSVVSEPLLSPPHRHMIRHNDSSSELGRRQIESYYHGSVTSKSDPSSYLNLISRLVRRYETLIDDECDGDERSLPLIINSDGWVKGLGYEILTTIVEEIAKPGQVVQILGGTKSKSFDLATTTSDDGNAVGGEGRKVHVVESIVAATAMSPVPSRRGSPVPPVPSGRGGSPSPFDSSSGDASKRFRALSTITSSDLRSLRLLAYFCEAGQSSLDADDDPRDYDVAEALASARPYAVPFDAVRRVVDGVDDKIEALDALNGSVVGLCVSPSSSAPSDGERSDSAVALRASPCVGLGLVRSIDRVRRLFFVLTPVTPTKLANVNVFVGGTVQLPSVGGSCRGASAESFPYQRFCSEGRGAGGGDGGGGGGGFGGGDDDDRGGIIGSDYMRSRNNLARRGRAGAGD